MASWDEQVYADIDGEGETRNGIYLPRRGLSDVASGYTYTGEMEGSSTLHYLLGYRDGDDVVIGLERFEGSIGGHDGSCVLQHVGSHGDGAVRAQVTVVPGMGTGGLATLRGEADLVIAGHRDDGYELVLHYALD